MLRFASIASLVIGLAASAHAAEEPKEIAPAAAKEHAGKLVAVTFEVKSAKTAKNGKVYLDSSSDFKDPANVAAALSPAAVKKFAAAGIADPVAHFRGKTIKVTAKVDLYEGRAYLNVDDPQQIAAILVIKIP